MSNDMMSAMAQFTDKSGTLAPLEGDVRRGLEAITTAAFMSIGSTVFLFSYLSWRLITWKQRGYAHVNQYVAILLNLIFADLIQAIGFSLSLHWLRGNSITADTSACWTQGWFINAGDVGACFFTLAMGVLLFFDIVLERRIKRYPVFLAIVVGIWTLDFFLASIGIALHPTDFYRRAGMWCWINEEYLDERLAFHYIWVLLTEFGTVVLYTIMFVTLWRRVRQVHWDGEDVHLRQRAQSAAWSVIAYPIVYVVCTLPAVIARLSIMTGHKVGYIELSVVGFMLTSNGWLDVILYTTTRRSLITGPPVQDQELHALDTFVMCRGDGGISPKKSADQMKKNGTFGERHDLSTRDSWGDEDINREVIIERKTRDFTAELDAVWRPQGMEAAPIGRAQTMYWDAFERICDEHGRHREVFPKIGEAK